MSELPILNAAFYQFASLTGLDALRRDLERLGEEHAIKGSIILSYEGINAMLAAPTAQMEAFLEAFVALRPSFPDIVFKRSTCQEVPFHRLLIKVKPEIVTMRVDQVDAVNQTGAHLTPEQLRDWLRQGKEMVFLDVRNDFECQLGTFRGAINPETEAFHQFPDYVRAYRQEWQGRPVVMFCTGGIRCEKATSWMRDEGIEEVYQLEGGILNYFEKIEDADRDWDGGLFVFDERVTLDTHLRPTGMTLSELQERFPSQSPDDKT